MYKFPHTEKRITTNKLQQFIQNYVNHNEFPTVPKYDYFISFPFNICEHHKARVNQSILKMYFFENSVNSNLLLTYVAGL